jgi:hypothetical protein
MGPAGDFWNHTAEPGMQRDARRDLVGEQFDGAVVVEPDETDAGLIARTLDAHDDPWHQPATSRSSVRAGRVIV